MFGNLIDSAVSTAINVATSPIRTAGQVLDLAEGLTEGEIRTEVIARLGSDAIKDLTLDEVVTLYKLM